jgi:3-phenylpropionate/cinnamic acid dioxygenase small subunit
MTQEKLNRRLLEDVVIYSDPGKSELDAQSFAHGRSTRASDRAPARLTVRPGPVAGDDLQRRVEGFLFYQSELLDTKQWSAYIDLFADNGLYFMPATPDQTEWLDSPSIFAEDRGLMEIRMRRVMHPNAWSQAPAWATSHVVGNVVIEEQSASHVLVRSRFQMLEIRRDSLRHFAGTYRHSLARVGDDFKIVLQRVDLLNAQSLFDYVLQVWV